jgi:outer membrane protein assembly factor BamB
MPLDFNLRKTLSRFLIAALSGAALGGSAAPFSGQISGWRGDGSGRFENAKPPIEWDGESGKNILWKTKVGLSKFSSLALLQDRIFVVAEPARLICLDAIKGDILWERTNGFADLPIPTEPKQPKNEQPNTTPTPISDGQFVYVVFGSGIIACYDLAGQRQWIQYLEAWPGLDFGRSSSPALSGSKLLVSIHHLFALDVKTGRVLWKDEKVLERYGTPVVTKVAGVELLVTPSGQIVRLDDGTLISTATELNFASPVTSESTAYFIGTSASAVSLSKATADVVGKSLWKTDLEGSYYASPVQAGGLLYTASNEGNFLIINAADGKVVVTRELAIGSASGRPDLLNANIYPSLALAGSYIFLSNDIGDTLVLESGKDYKEVNHNLLGEGFSGAPVFAGGKMYLRTKERLYCIGQK